jgi:hypothetical protein
MNNLQSWRLHRLRSFLANKALPAEVRCLWASLEVDLILHQHNLPTNPCFKSNNNSQED